MSRLRWLTLLSVLTLVIAACGTPAATTTTAAPTTTATTAAPPTTTDGTDFEGKSVAAQDCGYGGKILSIEATSQYEVTFTLCSPVPAFQQIVAFNVFGVQPEEHLEATGGAPLADPIGTGPYVLDAWNRGDSIVYQQNPDYWGDAPAYPTLVYRWGTESAARLLELQSGNADYITNVAPSDIATVEGDANLVLLPNRAPNILYLGMSTGYFDANGAEVVHEPFDQLEVRQAFAMGLNRQQLVDNFFAPGSEVASHFVSCSVPNACTGDPWYDFDAEAAQQLLADAGASDLEVTLYYRDVVRPYLPEAGPVAQEIAQDLSENLGISVNAQAVESGEFIEAATIGAYPLYLLGWTADYPHITNFLDFHFGEANPQFGATYADIYEPLVEASALADAAATEPLYEAANNAIRANIPMVPISHAASNDAALASLEGGVSPVFGAPQFQTMNPGKDTLVFVQNEEPISLYCADETDGESLAACQPVIEGLLGYDNDGQVVPKLATECVANEDSTVWTCTLREGVTFHDGSTFDANDVVTSWEAGIDAASPLHVGNSGVFEYYTYLWTQLINALAG